MTIENDKSAVVLFDNQNKDVEWLTTLEAANYLRISASRLYELCSLGKVPYYKFGRSNRFRKDELRDLLMIERRGPNGS